MLSRMFSADADKKKEYKRYNLFIINLYNDYTILYYNTAYRFIRNSVTQHFETYSEICVSPAVVFTYFLL